MNDLVKKVPRTNAVSVMNGTAAISLNSDGFVDIRLSREQFTEAIRAAFDPKIGVDLCIVAGDCSIHDNCGIRCGVFCGINSILGLRDIRILVEKGLLLENRLTAEQVKAIQQVRG